MKNTIALKTILLLTLAILSLAACEKKATYSPIRSIGAKHDYAFEVVNMSSLYTREFPNDFPADSARVATLSRNYAVRHVLEYMYDTLYDIDTIDATWHSFVMQIVHGRPFVYLYSADTIGKRATGGGVTRLD